MRVTHYRLSFVADSLQPFATNSYTAAASTIRATQKNVHTAATDRPRHATPWRNQMTNPAVSSISEPPTCDTVNGTTNSDAINGSTYIMVVTLQYHHLQSSSIATTINVTTTTSTSWKVTWHVRILSGIWWMFIIGRCFWEEDVVGAKEWRCWKVRRERSNKWSLV